MNQCYRTVMLWLLPSPGKRSLFGRGCSIEGYMVLCGSKNYPYLPHERDFSLPPPPPPLWKFHSRFIHLVKLLGLWEPPGENGWTTYLIKWKKTRQMNNFLIECTYFFRSVSLAISMCLITTFWNMASSNASGLNWISWISTSLRLLHANKY